MNFGPISLQIFPKISSLRFRQLKHIDSINDTQQCLFDNIWNSKHDHQSFLASSNALSYYFDQQNRGNPTKRFSFYFVSKGRQPGIYAHWPEVLQQIENYPGPIFRGFYSFDEAMKAVPDVFGPHVFISESSK